MWRLKGVKVGLPLSALDMSGGTAAFIAMTKKLGLIQFESELPITN